MMKKAIIYLSLLLMMATACKKYEEGPLISLRTKEKRLCQTWNLEEVSKNGVAVDDHDIKYKWKFHKDGDFTLYQSEQNYDGVWETVEHPSRWNWVDNQEQIEIEAFNQSYYWIHYDIIKLKYDELILELTLEENLYRYVLRTE